MPDSLHVGGVLSQGHWFLILADLPLQIQTLSQHADNHEELLHSQYKSIYTQGHVEKPGLTYHEGPQYWWHWTAPVLRPLVQRGGLLTGWRVAWWCWGRYSTKHRPPLACTDKLLAPAVIDILWIPNPAPHLRLYLNEQSSSVAVACRSCSCMHIVATSPSQSRYGGVLLKYPEPVRHQRCCKIHDTHNFFDSTLRASPGLSPRLILSMLYLLHPCEWALGGELLAY